MELINAYDLYELEQADELLETGLQSLDALLGGGISPGTFLEIVGLSASGKSQFWYSLISLIQKKSYKLLEFGLFWPLWFRKESYNNYFKNFHFNFDMLYSVCS